MRPRSRLGPILLAGVLTGCAPFGMDRSYVDGPFDPGDSETLAAVMAGFVRSRLPTASSTVVLDPLPAHQSGNALAPAFAEGLRQAGFAVAASAAAPAGAHRIRYLVTPFENGTLVRLTIDATDAARHFVRSEAGLQARGPFMVRERSS